MKIFNDAVNKLTLLYVIALMIVSLSASLAVYKMADSQFDTRLKRQQEAFVVRQGPINLLRELDALRLQEQREARADLLFGLFIFNLVVLVGGGYLSYYAARSTLKPIKDVMTAQNRFTADASHELRTPLSAMKSEVEVALRDKKLTAEEARSVLSSNLEEIDNLEKITSALLELARLPNGSLALKKIDIGIVVDDCIKQMTKQAKQKNIKIVRQVSVKTMVWGEASVLQRLIAVLLDNAIKYSHPSGEVKITALQQKDSIKITVFDNGIGIKKADQQKVFERFYRADSARSKNKDNRGYGLGLSIAKNLADQLGTKIKVESTWGKGSEFSFLLRMAT